MELILINECKLKIMLDREDVEKYELDLDNADYDNTETRAAFWHILDLAKHQCGFDAATARVFVQLYPSVSGGCEMYVTKLVGVESTQARSVSKKKTPDGMLIGTAKHREVAYVFDCEEDLVGACRYLSAISFASPCAAYSSKGMFAITFFEHEKSGVGRYLPRSSEYSALDEFGKRYSSSADVAYIKEYCKCIAPERAVEKFASIK